MIEYTGKLVRGFYANSISANVNLENNLAVLLIISVAFFSYGLQESFSQQYSSDKFDLFIPEKMIVGFPYPGMITLNNPVSEKTLFVINTDNDNLQVDASVIVLANQNHGRFNITPINEGPIEVFASYNGDTDSAVAEIYSKQSGPQKLDLILPGNNTIASDLTGFVFVVDSNGLPVKSDRDIVVGLTPTEKIFTPHSIKILNGTTNVTFDFTVKATGSITAISPNLSSDVETITKTQQKIDVHMKVRPNIAAENVELNYVIWLTKDGKPYTIPYSLNVQIQSSNTDVVRLGVSPSSYKNQNSISISMRDGLVTGKLYAGESGVSEIFASVSGHGTASEIISVGPVVLVDGDIIDEINHTSDDSYRLTLKEPNYIIFDVFPDVTDDISYGFASVYYSNSTDVLDITIDSDSGTQITHLVEHTTLIPIKSEDLMISISSESGLTHNSNYLIDGARYPTHSKMFEIIADEVGEYTVIATGAKSHNDASLSVTTSYNTQYSIQLTKLPTKSDDVQPLIMVSIIDENSNILDIGDSFGASITLNIDSDDLRIPSSPITLYDNIGVISGTLNRVGTISVYSDKFGVANVSIIPSGVPVSIEILTPDIIHAGEKFPIIIHEVDASGIPINKKQVEDTSSSGFEKTDNQNIIISNQGEQQISIQSKLGGVFQKTIETFSNYMDFDVVVDIEKARVGQSVLVEIKSSINGIKYSVDSPFPYEQINDNTFLITPDRTVTNGQITIFGELDGFVNGNKKISLSSEDIAELKIITKNIDGQKISSPYTVSLGQDVKNNDGPFTYLIPPQQTIVQFSKEWSSAVGGYRLVELSLDGKIINGNVIDFFLDGDSKITAVYDRFVKVSVIDGTGSGVYSYGEMVHIAAPDKQIIPFLQIETFDYWIGHDNEKSTFRYEAVADLTVTAIYYDDYSGAMIVIVLGMVVVLVVLFRKGDGRIKYHLREVSDFITSKMKITLPKIDLSKKK